MTFILQRASPFRGAERATAALGNALRERGGVEDITYLVLLGDVPSTFSDQQGTVVHGPSAWWKALRSHGGRPGQATVVVGSWAAAMVAPIARWRAHRSVFVVWEHSLLQSRLASERRLRMVSRLARRSFKFADRVVAVSQPVADSVLATHHRSAEVIANLIAQSTTSQGAAGPKRDRGADPRPVLLAVGGLNEVKNHRLLLNALPNLPGLRLRIAGDGPCRSALEGLVDTLDLRSRVEFLGEVGDVTDLYAEASVLTCPSLSETFGLALFEAAQHRVPVAALDVEAINEIVPELVVGKLLSAPFTPERYAAMIEAMLDDPAGEAEFTRAEARRKGRLSAATIVAAWAAVLELEAPGERELL